MGEESVRKTSKEGEKKNELVISSNISNLGVGGNGIAGLLVFGGALAIAGFIAVASSFATNRNKAKANGKCAEPKTQQLSLDDNIKNHGIENTPNNDVGDAVSACHVTSDMSITQPLILEKKTDHSPTCFHHHQEIVLSDDSHPESGASSSNEECLASMLDNSGSQAQEDEPQESLQSIQTETKNDDDDDDKVVLESGDEEEESTKVTEETVLNSKEEEVKPTQTDTKDDDDDDNVVSESGEKEDEKEEKSKLATEGTTLNSKEEAEQDLKGEEEITESDIQSQEAQGAHKPDISASADTDVAVTADSTSNEKANFSVGLNHQPSPSHSLQLITWLMPMLLLASLLLLVLFTQQSLYVLDQGN